MRNYVKFASFLIQYQASQNLAHSSYQIFKFISTIENQIHEVLTILVESGHAQSVELVAETGIRHLFAGNGSQRNQNVWKRHMKKYRLKAGNAPSIRVSDFLGIHEE